MDAKEATAKVLSWARKKNGYTQVELGEEMGMSQSTVGEYMRGEIHPTIFTFIKFCNALGEEPDELMRVVVDLTNGKPLEPIEKNRFPGKYQELGYLPVDVLDDASLESTIKHLRAMYEGRFRRPLPMDAWETRYMLDCEEEMAKRKANRAE